MSLLHQMPFSCAASTARTGRRAYNTLRPQSIQKLTHAGNAQRRHQQSLHVGRVVTEQTTNTVIVDHGFCSEQGPRDTMEDGYAYDEEGPFVFGAVLDGHGGEAVMEWLSAELMPALKKHVIASSANRSPAEGVSATALQECFHSVDKRVLAYLEKVGGDAQSNAGSTATVAIMNKASITVANIGDSQAILCRKGSPVSLSTPHRVMGSGPEVKVEVDRVYASGGWIEDGRVCNIIGVARAFGDWEFKGKGLQRMMKVGTEMGYFDPKYANAKFTADPIIATPDVSCTPVTEDDEFVIIATDGLWDAIPPLEVVRWARKEFKAKKSATEIADSLVKLALKRYTQDNTTVVVFDLKGQQYWNPPNANKGGFFGMFGKK